MEHFLKSLVSEPIHILDAAIPLTNYTLLDLSDANVALQEQSIIEPDVCQQYIDTILKLYGAEVAYGGYLERRNLYKGNTHFNTKECRNIHLGVDFWVKAGTSVLAPISGKVHSFKNNNTIGDYGPTIVLEHKYTEYTFYTLYGHLSLESLKGLYIGKEFTMGEELATLGTSDINVNYAPHLHFQIIIDMGLYTGDYPGVCSLYELPFYKNNCPDPSFLLHL